MESPSTVSRYVSKKRVFPGGSSSSSGCKDVEVLEIPTRINRTPNRKSSKQKEVIPHHIIDVDMEEEDDGDVMIIDVQTGAKRKFMQDAFSSFPVGHSSSLTNGSSESHIQIPLVNGVVDDSNPNMLSGEDESIDMYYDDIIFDDYASTLSHFDHMNIPPNVEALFPWLPSSSTNHTKIPQAGTSTTKSRSQIKSADLGPSSGLNSSNNSLCPLEIGQPKDMLTSLSDSTKADRRYPKGKPPSKVLDSTTSSSNSYVHKSVAMAAMETPRRSKRSHASSLAYPNPNKSMYQSGSSFQSNVNGGSSYPIQTLTNPPKKHAYGLGTYNMPPMYGDLPSNMFVPSLGSSGFMGESAFVSANKQNDASPMASAPSTKNVDEILQKFYAFKKFDTVEDYSDHHYSKNGSSAKQPPKNWAKRIQEEWKILEKDLPDKIFVTVYESRMDLLRAVIVGAEGTPYHDGLFFFDVYFPNTYPNIPPLVHYHSGGLRINPNLYNCGKVCLSLLNTWSGTQKEKWIPNTSTMLQVLVSIQGLILNAKPYFNEPGYANTTGSEHGEKNAFEYNERTFMYSLQTMLYNIRRPPKYFEDYVMGHFCKHGRDILVSCKAYLDGAQVGCLAKGGVQDVDEGDKSCSQQFKNNLAGFITTLVNAFSKIGVKDCEEFISLARKGNGPPTAAHHYYY